MKKLLGILLAASILGLGAEEVLLAAPGAQTLTSGQLSSSMILAVEAGATSAQTTLGSLSTYLGGGGAFGATVITANSANAFAVGQNGATNPAFNVDTTTATSRTGLNLKSGGAAAGVALTVISSGTNEPVFIAGKGTGPVYLGGTTTTLAGLQVAQTASRVNDVLVTPGATGTVPIVASGGAGADANIGLEVVASGTGKVYIGGTDITGGVQVAQTATAVNDVAITNGATGTAPTIVTGGTSADTNIGITVAGKGTGPVLLGGTTTTLAGVQIAQTASRVNDLLVTPGATGTSVILSANSAGADANAGVTMTTKGSGRVILGAITTCSGTTTATCADAQRFVASVTGLTTAAGGVSATAMTVTASAVLSSAVPVVCAVNGYSGTGQPIVTNITPGTGQVSFQITNIASSGSLNATVPVACVVF